MAFINKSSLTPLLLTYENNSMYLHIDPQGCALFQEDSPEPLYRSQEPLLLAQGVMTASKTVHLVVLKANGELCYTLITDSGTPQTSLLAKLDIRATRYRRLFLFPKGKLVHIFYAYSNNAIPDLWRIEHRFWDGASWRSVHMGEVIHPREPLYHVCLDSQGNIHYLTMTFQGRQSLLFTNRFNGTFHIWGSPIEALKITGEVADMTALMTTDNVHHLFWIVKTPGGQFELRWAQQTDALGLAGIWQPSPSPIKTFSTPWKKIGTLERNGVLWLLAHTGEEVLMINDGKGWLTASSQASINRPIQWVHKGEKNFYQTYWLEDQVIRRAPAFHQEIGFNVKKQALPSLSVPIQPILSQTIPPTPPPVPAFYPEQSPEFDQSPPAIITENEINTLSPGEINNHEPILIQDSAADETTGSPPTLEVLPVLESPPDKDQQPQPLKEHPEFQSLLTTVAYLEQKNIELQVLVSTVSQLEEENSKLQVLVSTVAQLEQDNSKLQDLVSTVAQLEQDNSKLQDLVSTVAQLEQDNSKLQDLVSTVAQLEQDNSKLQNLVSTVAQLEQDNSKLQDLVSTVAQLENENSKLQSLVTKVTNLEKENSKLEFLVSSVTHLEKENSKLQSLVTTVSHLEQENSKLQVLASTVTQLEKENSELQALAPAVNRLEQENSDLRTLITLRNEQENSELQSLTATVAHLEEENTELRSFITSQLEQENTELQNLTSKFAYLEQENTNLSLAVQDLLARSDQILEVISEKDHQSKQEVALLEELIAAQTVMAPLTDLEPFKEAVSNLEQETQSLSQVLHLMLNKQEENDSSLEKLETQICQLQEEKEAIKNKGGFWNKWIT